MEQARFHRSSLSTVTKNDAVRVTQWPNENQTGELDSNVFTHPLFYPDQTALSFSMLYV
ncbi:hypothetical protein QF117_01950 [Vibrio sp. YMD68]|uniref:hypothetical protein n=1 Tax=Vibrio sp. YMD68 TaxID=3042300 RepID=UPI00249AF9E3|nr:hypothetical protein [Vibrio sp. YMD68]WGV98752.1 hypothetical protein QF117_01950 [Vibrio sp. YMD68]